MLLRQFFCGQPCFHLPLDFHCSNYFGSPASSIIVYIRPYMFTITQVIEKRICYNQELYLLFVERKKFSDSVRLKKLWEKIYKNSEGIL